MGGLTKAYHTWVCFLHKNGGHNKFIVEVSAEYLASAGATVVTTIELVVTTVESVRDSKSERTSFIE